MKAGMRALVPMIALVTVCLGAGIAVGPAYAAPPWEGKCAGENVTVEGTGGVAKALVIQHCRRAHSAAARLTLLATASDFLSGAVNTSADDAKKAAEDAAIKANEAAKKADEAAGRADEAPTPKDAAEAATQAATGGATDADVDAALDKAAAAAGTAASKAEQADRALKAVTGIVDKSDKAAAAAKESGSKPDDVDLANNAAKAENAAVKAFADALAVLEVEGLTIDTTEIELIKK